MECSILQTGKYQRALQIGTGPYPKSAESDTHQQFWGGAQPSGDSATTAVFQPCRTITVSDKYVKIVRGNENVSTLLCSPPPIPLLPPHLCQSFSISVSLSHTHSCTYSALDNIHLCVSEHTSLSLASKKHVLFFLLAQHHVSSGSTEHLFICLCNKHLK